MSATTNPLVISRAQVKLGGSTILDNISFRLFPGELCGLIGPSGAGKSTLMKVLLGLEMVTSGTVRMGGLPVGDSGAVGYVPQQDALHLNLTVRQALSFSMSLWLEHLPVELQQKRFNAVVQQVGLENRLELRIKSLSGGQKKRVSVALELLSEPQMLILDEPTSGLDPGLEAKMMSLFASLAEKGRMLMVATHAMQSLNICSVVVVLMQGRLIFIGTPSNALKWFEVEHFSGIFERIPSRKPEAWELEFSSSDLCRAFAERSPISVVTSVGQKEREAGGKSNQEPVLDARAKLEKLKKARNKS